MAATAGRIGSATLYERLDLRGLPSELSDLAATFNAMLDRLEESFQRLARFSADIAHELRTPVNNLRGEAEVALGKARSAEEYREVLGSGLEECGRLARLIDNLLFLARAESPETQIVREPADMRRELETVCAFYEATATEAGVDLTVQAQAGLVIDVDRGLFQRALGNLVANALAHSPRGGRVALRARRDGGAGVVEVEDTGCGIPAQHLPHVWDRFYRADPARSTAAGRVGLGLALVKGIVALHRGTVAIDSEVGLGTRVRLILPGVRDTHEGRSSPQGGKK
jgi:two-component system heavy metal sensor histidine kinase CusS